MPEDTKGRGRGKGPHTAAGVQAQEAVDVAGLKVAVQAEIAANADDAERIDALEDRLAALEGSA